jgi:signal peptidase I
MSIPLIILIATVVAIFGSLWKLFQKAGRASWEGLVPGYNLFVWQKITDRPWYWILILIIPGVQFLMLIIMNVNLAWSFGKRGTSNTLLAIFAPFYLLPKMAFSEDVKYTGNLDWKKEKGKGGGREWADALLFAIIVAFIVRTFIFEAFTIPTGSMEKSMLVGDYLFVSKARYGAKLPETPLSFPLTHHTFPVLGIPSFLEWQKLGYHRLPGWAEVELADPVVFNYPLGDTVVVQNEVRSWYQYKRDAAMQMAKTPEEFKKNPNKYLNDAGAYLMRSPQFDITIRPKDKKENYVKRCVGMPGTTLEITDGTLTIDGKELDPIPGLQHAYIVFTNKVVTKTMQNELKEDIGLNIKDIVDGRGKAYVMILTDEQRNQMRAQPFVDSLAVNWAPKKVDWANKLSIFPNDPNYDWSIDNFGPMWIPAKGATLDLTLDNLAVYRRAIEAYEGKSVAVKDGQILIDGVAGDSYTFTLDYYWMMGDNRHQSQDSRYFGFVPEDHVVGRPSFVWLSLDNERGWFDGKVRWSRMFRGVK